MFADVLCSGQYFNEKYGNYHLDKAGAEIAPWVVWEKKSLHPSARLTDVWSMIPFMVYTLFGSLNMLAVEEYALSGLPVGTPVNKVDPTRLESIKASLSLADRLVRALESDACHYPVQRAYDAIRLNSPASVLAEHIRTVRTTVIDEVQFRSFCYIPQEGRKAILNRSTDWGAVWEAFPSTKDDAERGIECFALGLNVACVFHMMMVLERGLAALADQLGVKRGNKEWGSLIGDIEKAIAVLGIAKANTPKGAKPPTAKAAKMRADRLTFYSEAAKEFAYFKDAWRNHAMHGRASYDENDARKVMTHVREFMIVLARHLKEDKR